VCDFRTRSRRLRHEAVAAICRDCREFLAKQGLRPSRFALTPLVLVTPLVLPPVGWVMSARPLAIAGSRNWSDYSTGRAVSTLVRVEVSEPPVPSQTGRPEAGTRGRQRASTVGAEASRTRGWGARHERSEGRARPRQCSTLAGRVHGPCPLPTAGRHYRCE
jgi:hypothetical protein